jgi:hypothetical protein
VCRFTSHTTKDTFYKIGVANRGASKRYRGARYGHFDIGLLKQSLIPECKAVLLEHYLLNNFKRYIPEHKFFGYTECFKYLSEAMLEIISNYTKEDYNGIL